MALADLQFEYRGLVFGAGTEFHVSKAEGFEGFEVRSSDSDLPRGDGAIRGLDYVAPRTIAFELAVVELTGGTTTYEQYWAQVRAAFAPSRDQDYPLTFKRPGAPERVIWCRPIQLQRSEQFARFNAVGYPPVVLRAVDPRIYASEPQSLIVPVYSASASTFELPSELPFDFSGGTVTEGVAVNNGTAPAYPLVRFYSPAAVVDPVWYPSEDIYPEEDVYYPAEPAFPGAEVSSTFVGTIESVKLTNTTTGDVLDIRAPIVDQQILVADMQAAVTGAPRLIVSVDDASRYGDWQLPRAAFALAPGSNTLRFEVSGTSVTARCQLTWQDTWID